MSKSGRNASRSASLCGVLSVYLVVQGVEQARRMFGRVRTGFAEDVEI